MLNTLKIKTLIENSGYKQKDFALLVGMTLGGLQHILRNGSTNTDTLEKIAKQLNVTVGYFFDEETASAGAVIQQNIHGNKNTQNMISDCEQRNKVLQAELDGLRRELAAKEGMLEAKNEIIELLKRQSTKK